MRPSTLVPLVLLVITNIDPSTADAESSRGSGSGGGRGPLGQTSAGVGAATGGGSSSSSGNRGPANETETSTSRREIDRNCYDQRARAIPCPPHVAGSIVVMERADGRAPQPYTGDRASISIYAGAQKVQDSDGSLSLEVTVHDAMRFRLQGTLHHYFETQPDMGRITMTMPTLMAGVRIDDLGTTAVHIDGGVVHAGTKGDPMGNSSITGPIVGMSIEHRLSSRTSLLGNVQTMWFEDDVRANAGRVGVRYGYLQATFRVLDFNVGPPLYGPEVGVRF